RGGPPRAPRLFPGGGASAVTSAISDWAAAPRAGGVAVGRLGRRLRPLAALRGGPPLLANPTGTRSTPAGSPLLDLSGTRLYAVVDSRCLHRRGAKRRALVEVNLRTGSRRPIATVFPGAEGLDAAGARVAITYAPDPRPAANGEQRPITVVVLDARRGRRLYRLSARVHVRPNWTLATQVDPLGDVLVTSTFFVPPAPQSSGWWATPADPAGHQLRSLATAGRGISRSPSAGPSPITGAAALSTGRIAYVTGGPHSEERIDLLDLHGGTHRSVANFLGVVGVVGLDLSGDELAWAQQSTIPEGSSGPVPGGGFSFSCDVGPLGPVQIASVDLRRIHARPLRIGPPLPAA